MLSKQTILSILATILSGGVLFAVAPPQTQAPPTLRQAGKQATQSQTNSNQAPASGTSSVQAASQPSPEEEAEAYQAIQSEADPDKQIQLVKDFALKYPNSEWLSDAYFIAAADYGKKNDAPDALSFGQKSLKAQPDNLRSLILVAGLLPLPQVLPSSAAQKQQQLSEAENDANHALQMLSALEPQNSGSTAFDQTKSIVEAQIHSALGMAHLEESAVAVSQAPPPELAALEKSDPNNADDEISPSLDACRQGEQFRKQNRIDDAINAYTMAAQQAGQDAAIASYANAVVQQLNAEKSQLAMAEQEFKTVTASPQPTPQDFYRLGEVLTREDKLDDAISAFTEAEQRAPGTLIQKYAGQMIQQVQTLKAKNPPPATPPVPPNGSGPFSPAASSGASPPAAAAPAQPASKP